MTTVPLVRRHSERMLAGVCSGLALHLGFPVLWVRIAVIVLSLFGGAGVLFYVFLWVTVPWESPDEMPLFRRALTKPAGQSTTAAAASASNFSSATSAAQPLASNVQTASSATADSGTQAPGASIPQAAPGVSAAPSAPHPQPPADPAISTPAPPTSQARIAWGRWPVAELLLGVGLLIAGLAFVLVQFGVELHLDVVLPAIAVLTGVGLAWWQIADRDRPDRNALPRVLGALVLVAVGVLMFFVTSREPNTFTVIAAAFAVLAGVALAAAPWVLRQNRELIAERAGREREAERAEIAAHLHDSVLQTLAAIQQRSEPGSEIARLARGQERELRDWLFRAADGAPNPAQESLAVELRTHAALLEVSHPVRFEIVAVGSDDATAPEGLLGSAKEAMLNAARHAGGDVTVYVESTPLRLSVDVTDRGPGFDPASLPDGRMGVRESIIGRMQRAGGTVNIVSGPGGSGVSVRLSMPRDMHTTEQSGPTPTGGAA